MNDRTQHTPEPWRSDFDEAHSHPWAIKGTDGYFLASIHTDCPKLIQQANAARIVACVNALAGLNPEALGELIAAAERILAGDYTPGGTHESVTRMGDLRAALAKVKS